MPQTQKGPGAGYRRRRKFGSSARRKQPKRKLRAGKLSAYRPSAKKAYKRMSNPFQENKQILGSEISATVGLDVDGKVVLTDYSKPPIDDTGTPTGAPGHIMDTQHWHFNPDSMMYQTQGLDESQMIGRSTYQTMCAAKFLFKWPSPYLNTGIEIPGDGKSAASYHFGAIPDQSMNYKLYWGWVPKKLLFTNETTPKANEASAFDIEQAINQRVSDYFNDRLDRTQFISKTSSTIKIIGSKKLYPPWDKRTGRMPTATVVQTGADGSGNALNNTVHVGEIPDTLVKVTWPINRKIHFEPSNKFGHRPAEDDDPAENIALANGASVFYRNYDHLPFAVVVSWNHDLLPEDGATPERKKRCPQVIVNDITYYRDS